MGLPGGVQITGFISPTSSGDTYATHDAIYGRDGLRNVSSLSDLNNIPPDRRRAGMIVGVSGDTGLAKHYTLLPEGTGWTYTIADWTEAFLSPSATTALVTSATTEETFVYFSATTEGQTIFNGVLPTTPLDLFKTKFFVNGVKQRYGNNFDYIITGGTDLVWLGEYFLGTEDELNIIYR